MCGRIVVRQKTGFFLKVFFVMSPLHCFASFAKPDTFHDFFPFFVICFRKTQKTSNFIALLYVFEGEESNGDKNTALASTVDLENPDQLPVKDVFEGMVMSMSQILSNVFVSAHNLFETHVFEVGESISDIPTELPRLDDLENPGQLPVQGGYLN